MSRVESSTEAGVCTVTLNDVEKRNVLSAELMADLMDALDTAEGDDHVRVIVLTNNGSVFCAGADLSGARTGSQNVRTVDPAELFGRFARSPKPYVGRIAGHCVAGGMGLAAAMDISIVIDTAKMGFTEVRIGVAPAMISVLCLPKMSAADAREAFLRGNRFLAPEAQRMGLINAAVPAEHLDTRVAEVVADLLSGGPGGLAAAKRILARVPEMSTDDAFAWTSDLSASLFRTDEAAEGMAAFMEKRSAGWVPSERSED